MSPFFPSSRKHPREATDSLLGDEELTDMAQSIEPYNTEKRPRKRLRQNNHRRDGKKGQRAARTNASKGLEGLAFEEDVEDDEDPILRRRQRKKDKQRASSLTSPDRINLSPIKDNVNDNISQLTQPPLPPLPLSPPPPKFLPLTKTPTTATLTTISDPFPPILTRINHHISTNNHRAAYILLSTTTRGTNWQSTATRSSLLQICKLTKLLGDGKTQCLEQARMINDARWRDMELEAEIKVLRKENERLKGKREESEFDVGGNSEETGDEVSDR